MDISQKVSNIFYIKEIILIIQILDEMVAVISSEFQGDKVDIHKNCKLNKFK